MLYLSFDVMFIYKTITIKTDKLRGAYKYTYILKQLILNYEIFWHNYRYGEGNTTCIYIIYI